MFRALANSFEPPIRRVNIQPAKGFDPAIVTVYFRDERAAKDGFTRLLGGIAKDPRTQLDIHAKIPTLTYAVI